MTDASKIAENYIAAWNETDADRRMALLARDWAAGVSYVDPIMSGKGHAEISALIGGVHERFPGFRFALLGEPDGYDGHARFSWGLGPAGSDDAPIKGSDVVVLEGGRLTSVIGFLDQVPAA